MNNSSWGDSWADAWGDSWGDLVFIPSIDGSGLIITRKRRRAPPPFKQRLPEDIRREQLEEERYLASLEKQQQVPAKATSGDRPEQPATTSGRSISTPAAAPILADVAARAASAVQDKIEASAAAHLANKKRRQTLALLLAID